MPSFYHLPYRSFPLSLPLVYLSLVSVFLPHNCLSPSSVCLILPPCLSPACLISRLSDTSLSLASFLSLVSSVSLCVSPLSLPLSLPLPLPLPLSLSLPLSLPLPLMYLLYLLSLTMYLLSLSLLCLSLSVELTFSRLILIVPHEYI